MSNSSTAERWVHFEDEAEAKGYAIISNVVMRDPTLSMQAKYLYGLLKSYAWQDDVTYPGVKTLCDSAGVSKDTLGKYLKELVKAGLLEVKRRGQGKTNLYVFKKVTNRRDRDGDTGSHQERGEGSDLNGDASSHNEYAVDKDSVTTSRRDAFASSGLLKNPFGYYCEVAKALRVKILPEDRQQTSKHFKDLVLKDEPNEEELKRVVSKMLEARTAGVFWSPQKTLEIVRGNNVTPLRREQSHEMSSTAGYREFS